MLRERASREDKEDTATFTRAHGRAIRGYPSNNLDINQLWRAHCRLRTMDIVLFERPTKSNGSHARCACGIQSTRYLWSGCPVCAHARVHTRALSAVRLLLKARCPRGIIHCERGASRKRNVGITADHRWPRCEKNGRDDRDRFIGTESATTKSSEIKSILF